MQQRATSSPTRGRGTGPRPSKAEFGSDVVVELLEALGIRYIALNPGSSYRGLHDSIVNFGMAPGPEMILCCHEQIAVAVAGGYARVTGQPMAVGVHNVVGLQNAVLGIYSAYCDRSPMLVLGGTGPIDTTHRRAHIDWVHTALVQGNLVRDFVKWDDQPATVAAIPDSVLRGYRIAMTPPQGPVYLCFDVDLQEQSVETPPMLPDVARYAPPRVAGASSSGLREAASLLIGARWPLILPETTGSNREALPALQELAELLGCAVVDSGAYFNFPSTHPLDLTLGSRDAIAEADVVLALDVLDLAGAVGARLGLPGDTHLQPDARVIHITLGDFWHSAWAGDWERLHPVDLPIAADTAEAIPSLVELCRAQLAADPTAAARIAERRERIGRMHDETRARIQSRLAGDRDKRPISSYRLYKELWELIQDVPWSLSGAAGQTPLRAVWDVTEPDHRSGAGRAGGIGYSSAAALGSALAYRDSGRLPINISGDGSFLMLPQLLWTAANSQIPILYVIYNNRSYGNDEAHQEFVARARGRSLENTGIGIKLDEPPTDFARVAQGFGVEGFGPVTDPDALRPALEQAIRVVREQRRAALVDVVVGSGSGVGTA